MENTRDLLVRGVAAAKARLIGEARFYLEWLLRLEPPKDQKLEALYWLSTLVTDPDQEREMLESILAEEPFEPRARRRLLIIDGKLNANDVINADHYEQEVSLPAVSEADRFTCPKCGGRLTYAADGSSLECEYCNTRQYFRRQTASLTNDRSSGNDFIAAMATASGHNQIVEQQLLTCQGCGAEFMLTRHEISAICPFCRSPQVVNLNTVRQMIPPSRIIPVEVGFPQAFAAARASFSGDLDINQMKDVRPAFYPVWQFEMSGSIGWRLPDVDSTDDLKESKFFGEEPVDFYFVPVMAVSNLPDRFHDLVREFDYNRVVEYNPQYLVDCLAVGNQIPLSDAALEAREQTVRDVTRRIEKRLKLVTGDFFINSSSLFIAQFWLTLVPIWVFHDPHSKHVAIINGQNGRTRVNNYDERDE